MIAQYVIVAVVAVLAAAFMARKVVLVFTKKNCATGSCGCAASELKGQQKIR